MNAKYPKSGDLTKDVTVSGANYGVLGTWYQGGVYTDGWYVSPGISTGSVKAESADAAGDLKADGTVTLGRVVAGYGWFWDSFNMMLGVGGNAALGDSKVTFKDTTGNQVEETNLYSSWTAEYKIGWSF